MGYVLPELGNFFSKPSKNRLKSAVTNISNLIKNTYLMLLLEPRKSKLFLPLIIRPHCRKCIWLGSKYGVVILLREKVILGKHGETIVDFQTNLRSSLTSVFSK